MNWADLVGVVHQQLHRERPQFHPHLPHIPLGGGMSEAGDEVVATNFGWIVGDVFLRQSSNVLLQL